MGKIRSKKAPPPPAPPAPQGVEIHGTILIVDANGTVPLSAEELEEIGRVFENIRKQIDIILDWERLAAPLTGN